jgi:DNA invertase Pin-like site-specific DNA recombinase
MGILALIAEFETDIRRERQQDGIKRAIGSQAAAN